MAGTKPTDRTVFQNAWVVDNLEAAAERWVSELGVGPFFIAEYGPGVLTDVTYRGAPSELTMRVALAQAGPVQIELIQPTVAQCAYRDSVPVGQTGFHHLCTWTHDIEADTAFYNGLGYETANAGNAGRARFAYYDTRPLYGAMMEVVEHQLEIEAMFNAIAAAAEGWNGERAIRTMADL